MFIQKEDYTPIISDEELAVITGNDAIIRKKAEKMAIQKISKYLARQYDVKTIFEQIGSARDSTILEYTMYFTLYILYSRIAKGKVPDDRYAQYTEAKEFLHALQKDEIDAQLPRLVNNQLEPQNDRVRFGANRKINHYY